MQSAKASNAKDSRGNVIMFQLLSFIMENFGTFSEQHVAFEALACGLCRFMHYYVDSMGHV